MIERLKETGGVAFGFKVVGKLLDEELKAFEPQLEFFIAQHKKRLRLRTSSYWECTYWMVEE